MGVDFPEWLNLAIRWLHLTAGIAWIGSSFYFVWLDLHLTPPKKGDASGEVWSVHGGGFYHNQKYQVAPAQMPDRLHWFKWEAYWTWISGFSLLVLVYYVGAQSFLIDPAKAVLSPWQGIAIGLASLVFGWIAYDRLCRSSIGASNQLLGICWFLCLLFAAFALNSVFTARGAYLHIGAIIGSVMVGNVFFVIIPNQKKVVADLIAGRTPDPALGAAAKQRSLHNNYMTLPVLFIMISHHYPMTYGAERPWLVLALLGLTGVAVRHVFNLRHREQSTGRAMAVAAVMALISVTYVSMEKGGTAAARAVSFAELQPLIVKHCATCHSATPSHPEFPVAPLGLKLDSYEQAKAAAPRIKAMTVDSEVMPLGNVSGMTKDERETIGAWIASGSPK
ncbi:urate hydroxylase PuuD [Sphingomonas soli]|uniref:urate hydroxylase PuuD n=1 Tax=Sphingomonas soli TaxID=266127 RepID=UPI0008359D3D|nr:urate hydroxylase PuuD [Sphingomonas soli]